MRALLAPLNGARPGRSLPGVPFSREAVANAFVMLGLLPEARAEEILAGYRTELEAKGFRFGVLTGELSVRPGAYGYQDARAASREDLTGIPLAVVAAPVPLPVPADSTAVELTLIWATLTSGGAKLRFSGASREDVGPPRPSRPGKQLYRMVFSQERPGLGLADAIRTGMSVTDNLGRSYRLRPSAWRSSPRAAGQPGRRYDGEMLAEPEPAASSTGPGATVSWLEFAAGPGPAVRVVMATAAGMPVGPAAPPWPTPAQCYLAQLSAAPGVRHRAGPGRLGRRGAAAAGHGRDREHRRARGLRLDPAVRGSGGGAPEGSYEFWFWPPVAPEAKRIRVTVSTLWEAAWAEADIPGRP
jgi:hypothetical protein